MRLSHYLLPALIFAASGVFAVDTSHTSSPFQRVALMLQNEIEATKSTWKASLSTEQKEKALKKLTFMYDQLHDIRNYRTFGKLWDAWGWKRRKITLLYVASGSHLAPLEFLHRGNLEEIHLIYTEINPAVFSRLESLLELMRYLGYYSKATRTFTPDDDPTLQAMWKKALKEKGSNVQHEWNPFLHFVARSEKLTGHPPGFAVRYTFRYGESRVTLDILFNLHDNQPGSTPLYRFQDFSRADLIITHDWSHDPRKNLAMLKSFMDSACMEKPHHPLFVMMENLERYPFPVSMALFNLVAHVDDCYGHRDYALLPDGERVEAENGPCLYHGGVLLRPNIRSYRRLQPSLRKTLFNLLLFKDHLFNRRNVALNDKGTILAPLILDLETHYGLHDIEGNVIDYKAFLPSFLTNCATLLNEMKSDTYYVFLCKYYKAFLDNLKSASTTIISEKELMKIDDDQRRVFLSNANTMKKYKEALKHRSLVMQELQERRKFFRMLFSSRKLKTFTCDH